MAERVGKKAGKRAPRTPAAVTGDTARRSGGGAPRDRLRDLEAECARLKAELAAAKSRLAELEKQRELLVNRIDWVIDSLHSLTEE